MKRYLLLAILVMAVANPAMTGLCNAAETSGLNVYQPIPGITPSTRFSVRVTDATTRAKWFDVFTMETVGPVSEGVSAGAIYPFVTGHSSSWATFEYDAPVEVKIKKLSPGPINQCVVKPRARGITSTISADKTEVTLIIPVRKVPREKITTASDQAPVNITAEINGQSKETISIFASPHLARKPSLSDPGVLRVDPGTNPPATGSWHTLYFMPGIHNFGKKAYAMQANRSYYIPGDAWIESPFTAGGDNTRIFGMGVMSQRTIPRIDIENGNASKMMTIHGRNAVLEGLTLVDSQHHTLFGSKSDESNPVVIRNVKLQNWLANTDGIHFFTPGIAEDCFFRTQDDMKYFYHSTTFRRMVYWKDETFGEEAVMPGWGTGEKPQTCREEDSDSIYYNCKWNGACLASRYFGNTKINGGIIDGYRIEKPGNEGQRPFIDLEIDEKCTEGFIKGLLFKDVHVLNDVPSRINIQGQPTLLIEDITFQDIRIGSRWVEDFSSANFGTLENARNIRIIRNGQVVATYPPTTKGTPPTIKDPASASPSSTVTGTTVTLSAMGASAAGEDKLAYYWATTGTPPAGVTFSPNGTNSAKTTLVTFSKIGTYNLQVTIHDGSGQTVTSKVTITVNQTLTGIAVSPSSSAILPGATVALAAQARDQFKDAMAVQPTFAWSIDAGGVGTVSNSGAYKAPASGTGAATIRATTTSVPGISGTAAVSFSPSTVTPPTIDTAAKATPNPVTDKSATLSVMGATTASAGEASLTYTWATIGTPPASVTFSVNGTNEAKTTVVTFSKVGIYTLQATIRDGSGQTITSNVTVTVSATLSKIAVSPSSSAILTSATVALTAQANDKFGAAMAPQPTFAWTIDAAGAGTVSSTGVYTAPASGTSNATIRATTTSVPAMSGTAAVSYSPSGSTGGDTGDGGGGGGCGLGASFAGLLLAFFFLLKARLRLVDKER
jgi:hypothetical protein